MLAKMVPARGLPLIVLLGSFAYFSAGLATREASLLESQDFGIACDLWNSFGLTPDHSPLHFVFMNAWQHVSTSSFAAMRLPSAIACSVAAMIVFMSAALEAGPLAGAIAALFFTVNPLVVDNARSLRMYSWSVMLSALCLYFTYRFACRGRRIADLRWFAFCSVLSIYNHLFGCLLFASLSGLIALDLLFGAPTDAAYRRRAFKVAWVTGALLVPQVIHAFAAIAYTHERHARYAGISESFSVSIARTLFVGESTTSAIPNAALGLPICLVLLGIGASKKRGLIAALAILPPGLLLAWILSLSSEVEARYLNYLTPLLAIFMSLALVKIPKGYALAPLALAVLAMFVAATREQYAVENSDWYEAGRRIAEFKQSDDVVAVFPGYWSWTFRRYSNRHDVVPITYPIDLDRVLARGKRVILVRNSGREFSQIAALLADHTHSHKLFSTRVRDPLDVYSIKPVPPDPERSNANEAALVLTGLIGSGGYAWQAQPRPAHVFDRVKALFGSSSAVVSGYVPYDPPWYLRAWLGSERFDALRPNARVLAEMRDAGIRTLALPCSAAPDLSTRALFKASGVIALTPSRAFDLRPRRVLEIGNARVGIVSLACDPFRGIAQTRLDPSMLHHLARAIADAKLTLGNDGHLLVSMPQREDYGRAFGAAEQLLAHTLVDAGAEVVVGSGGYAAKEVEPYHGGVIAYSLGTLVRPATLSLATRDSSGIALRLTFGSDRGIQYRVVPMTFDDRSIPAFGRRGDIEQLVHDSTVTLSDRLASAEVSYVAANGSEHTLGAWQPRLAPPGSTLVRRLTEWLEPSVAWFPVSLSGTNLRPLYDGFAEAGGYAAARGVQSLGRYRRAIELNPGEHDRIRIRFKALTLGDRLQLTFGLPDDRLGSKFIALPPQDLVVDVSGIELLRRRVPYQVGWRVASIDTSRHPTKQGSISVTLETHGTHFPVAFDIVMPKTTLPIATSDE